MLVHTRVDNKVNRPLMGSVSLSSLGMGTPVKIHDQRLEFTSFIKHGISLHFKCKVREYFNSNMTCTLRKF